MNTLPLQIVSEEVLLEKYAKGTEQSMTGDQATHEIRRRVAKALASQEKDPELWES